MTPLQAYEKARSEGPSNETRSIACTNAYSAWLYAVNVDRGTRPDTQNAASLDDYWKTRYEEAFTANRPNVQKHTIIQHIRLTYVLGAALLLSMSVNDIEDSQHFLVTVTIASILAAAYIFWPTKKYNLSRIIRQYPFVVSLSLALLLSIPLQVITLLPNTHPSLPLFLALCYALYKAPSHASEARVIVRDAFFKDFEDTKP